MNKQFHVKSIYCIFFAFLLIVVSFYFLGGEQLYKKAADTGDRVSAANYVEEITVGRALVQPFSIDADSIDQVSFLVSTCGRLNKGTLFVSIWNSSSCLASSSIAMESIVDGADLLVRFFPAVKIEPNERLYLHIESDGVPGNAVTVFYGRMIQLSKGSVAKELREDELATYDGTPLDGILCFQATGEKELLFGQFYWYFIAAAGVLLLAFCGAVLNKKSKGIPSVTLRFFDAVRRYKFLMQQLISRDFKAKYKRSILGVLWSFLNPLFMMMIYYIVFSTIFQSDSNNFPVYLIIGIVCFNFFSEATNMALHSIVGNASLITKVYMPKYIFPVSRVLSSTVNLLLSLVPLFLVLLYTKTQINIRFVLIVFGLISLIALSLGVGMILSSLMVFFRDTQFLWGVIITMLNFGTPIFYPENIIPENFMPLFKMNPLYHIIRFIRTVIIDGVSPEPKAYLFCIIASIIPLLLGMYIFKKTQDKFILNL